MKRVVSLTLTAVVIVGVGAATGQAQVGRCDTSAACTSPACNRPSCEKQPCANPREITPPAEERELLPPVAPGMFSAPPRGGEVAGPTRSLGINGLKITFPEFTIGLPSIQLPSFTRFRRGAHMRLDRAAAPYMENPYYGEALVARQLQQARIREAIEEEERAARERAARERNVGCVDQGGSRGAGDEPSCEARIRALQDQLQKLQDCLDGVRNELSATPRPPRPPADFPPNIRNVPPTNTTGSARPSGPIQKSTYEVAEPQYLPPVIEVRRLPAPINQTPPSRLPLLRRLPFVAEG